MLDTNLQSRQLSMKHKLWRKFPNIRRNIDVHKKFQWEIYQKKKKRFTEPEENIKTEMHNKLQLVNIEKKNVRDGRNKFFITNIIK